MRAEDTRTFTVGKRVYAQQALLSPALRQGEYCLAADGSWWLRPPAGPALRLRAYWITVHDEGTISVRRELFTANWRGYLERGTWGGREV